MNGSLHYEEEMDLGELWSLIKPSLPFIVVVTLSTAVFTYLATMRSPKVYEAEADVLVVDSGPGYRAYDAPAFVSALDPEAYKLAALTHSIVSQAGLLQAQEEDLLRVRVKKGTRSAVLALYVRGHDPRRVSEQANRWAEALLAWERRRVYGQLEQQQAVLRARLEVLDQQIKLAGSDVGRINVLYQAKAEILRDLGWIQALVMAAEASSGLRLLEAARPPEEPVAPRPKLMAALAGMLTFLALAFVVVIRQVMDPRVSSSEEVAQLVDLPVFTEFPKAPRGIHRELFNEAANFLRVNVDRALIGEAPKVVVITSPEESEGKSSVSLALARAYARAERRVLLIDADLRQPVLDEELGVSSENGLVSYLQRPFEAIRPHPVEDFMDFIPAGRAPDDPSGLLTEHWKQFLARVVELERYEVIVVDSAPVLPVADTLIIVPHASGAILVVAEGRTWKRRLLAARELLQRVGARVLGVAMTHVRQGVFWGSPARYGYGYGYGGGRLKREVGERGAEPIGRS